MKFFAKYALWIAKSPRAQFPWGVVFLLLQLQYVKKREMIPIIYSKQQQRAIFQLLYASKRMLKSPFIIVQ